MQCLVGIGILLVVAIILDERSLVAVETLASRLGWRCTVNATARRISVVLLFRRLVATQDVIDKRDGHDGRRSSDQNHLILFGSHDDDDDVL